MILGEYKKSIEKIENNLIFKVNKTEMKYCVNDIYEMLVYGYYLLGDYQKCLSIKI
jgi:hypothetical protein